MQKDLFSLDELQFLAAAAVKVPLPMDSPVYAIREAVVQKLHDRIKPMTLERDLNGARHILKRSIQRTQRKLEKMDTQGEQG